MSTAGPKSLTNHKSQYISWRARYPIHNKKDQPFPIISTLPSYKLLELFEGIIETWSLLSKVLGFARSWYLPETKCQNIWPPVWRPDPRQNTCPGWQMYCSQAAATRNLCQFGIMLRTKKWQQTNKIFTGRTPSASHAKAVCKLLGYMSRFTDRRGMLQVADMSTLQNSEFWQLLPAVTRQVETSLTGSYVENKTRSGKKVKPTSMWHCKAGHGGTVAQRTCNVVRRWGQQIQGCERKALGRHLSLVDLLECWQLENVIAHPKYPTESPAVQ